MALAHRLPQLSQVCQGDLAVQAVREAADDHRRQGRLRALLGLRRPRLSSALLIGAPVRAVTQLHGLAARL